MFKLVRAFAVVALVVASPSSAFAQTKTVTPEERAAAISEPSIVYIETYYTGFVRLPSGELINTQPFNYGARCTGFSVGGGYIVTAGHCADVTDEGANATFIEMALVALVENGDLSQEQAEGMFEEALGNWKVEGRTAGRPAEMEVFVQWANAQGGKKSGDALPARVLESKPLSQGDVAVLKIEKELPALGLIGIKDIQIGTPVLAVGYPASSDEVTDQSVQPTFKDGRVSARKTREGGLLPVYEISAAMSQGMSGGPVIDLSGSVVGLNSFMINGENQAFNFLSPASLILEALGRAGATNTLTSTDRDYRAGLRAFWSGDGKTAVTKLTSVLDAFPAHPRAQELLRDARKVAATQKGSGLPIVPIGIAAAVVAAGLVGMIAMKSRKTAAPAYTQAYVPASPVSPAAITQGSGAVCSNCGSAIAGGVAFCGSCGTPVAQGTAAPK